MDALNRITSLFNININKSIEYKYQHINTLIIGVFDAAIEIKDKIDGRSLMHYYGRCWLR